jgi:hypothetical protein
VLCPGLRRRKHRLSHGDSYAYATCVIHVHMQLKSFLTGSPELKMGLVDGVTIKSLGIVGAGGEGGGGGGGGGAPVLTVDAVHFHECVRW